MEFVPLDIALLPPLATHYLAANKNIDSNTLTASFKMLPICLIFQLLVSSVEYHHSYTLKWSDAAVFCHYGALRGVRVH